MQDIPTRPKALPGGAGHTRTGAPGLLGLARRCLGGLLGYLIGPGQCLQVGQVDLLAGEVQRACGLVEHRIVTGFAGFREGQQVAQHTLAAQQGRGHGVGHGQQAQC